MMLKTIGKAAFASGLLASSLAWADPMAVKDGVVFVLAGNQLKAYPVLPTEALPAGCPTTLATTAATDILVSRGRAIVTPGTNHAAFDSIDISACLSGSDSPDNTKADLSRGLLEIMCAKVGDGAHTSYYHIIMKQRGNSSNWEVTFAEPFPFCARSGD
ncbi:MAG: hypothetical protein PHH26_05590 [Candidatus Thermoplasmatota archaeon]|nr:hypothetical protein [Candidatus Thermoplasmatota archaeon]